MVRYRDISRVGGGTFFRKVPCTDHTISRYQPCVGEPKWLRMMMMMMMRMMTIMTHHLITHHVEVTSWRSTLHHAPLLHGAPLQVTCYPGARVSHVTPSKAREKARVQEHKTSKQQEFNSRKFTATKVHSSKSSTAKVHRVTSSSLE